MLVQLGRRSGPGDVVALLYECHGRIRRFLDLAARLAAVPDVDAASVRDAAGQIRRYFAEALPMHVADEDELVAAALRGRSERVGDAIAQMHAEHEDHAALIGELIDLCGIVHAESQQLVASAGRLAGVTAALRAALDPHLAMEEREIFPELAALPEPERASLQAVMRERRAHVLRR